MGGFRGNLRISILLVTLINIPNAFTAPLSSQQPSCSPSVCRQSPDSSKLKYEEGKTYTYEFDTSVVTKLVGTTDDQSKINVKGQALLAAKSPCEFVLTVKRAEIQGPTRQVTEGVQALEGSSILFSYQDGSVENVCISESDPSWSANIKRALVSMLQNKAVQTVGDATVMEVDISGRCPTTYALSGSKYTKTRPLNSCTYRDGGFWVLQGTQYYVSSEANSAPVLNSSLTCVQDIPSGIIQSVECEEVHKLTPLSAGEAGVQTLIKSTLNLRSTSSGIPTVRSSKANLPSSLFYDHSKADKSLEASRKAGQSTETLLQTLCTEVKSGTVSSAVPGLAQSLRKSLRAIIQVSDLVSLFDRIEKGQICPTNGILTKLFLDAAAKAGTTETISFVADLVGKGKVDKSTQAFFAFYANVAPRPDAAALAAITPLITPRAASEIILAASGLAHRYCHETNPECSGNGDYNNLMQRISQLAADNCMATDEKSSDLAVTALQALGNLDSLSDPAINAITKCLKGSDRIRVRALDAFRRDPCQPKLKREALQIFQDKDSKATSDVRIQAYLATIRCVQQEDIDEVQRTLSSEDSNQVGSFVSSHIRNTLESASPWKRQFRAALRQLSHSKAFPNDPRKFSRNFEVSQFSPAKNLGFSAESNVIYSSDSFIPRTSTANLTVDLFGRSYNFIEFGLYLENFEHLVEKYFGPTKSPRDEISRNVESSLNNFKNDLQSRFRRSLSPGLIDFNDIERTRNEVSAIKSRFGNNGHGDFYIRNLGTTILSSSFDQEQLQGNVLSRKFFSLFDKLLEGAKDHNVELTEPITFLEEELVIPTIAGLPLNLELEGATVLSVQLKGKLDIPALLKKNYNSDVQTRILPSAATEIRARMTAGAGPIQSGLQIAGKIHTASGIDLAIARSEGKFELKVNLPEEKVQVIDVRSQLFWVEADGPVLKETPLVSKLTPQRRSSPNNCMVSSALGLRLCAQLELPVLSPNAGPGFPLSGDAVVGLSLEKTEASMEGYYLKVDTSVQTEAEKTISVVFDTPGSTVNRRWTGEGQYSVGQSPKILLDVQSPFNKFNLQYQRWNDELLKGLEVKVKSDSAEYGAIAQVQMTKIGSTGMEYEPVFTYTTPSATTKVIEGKVTREFGRKMDIDLRLAGQLRALQGKIAGSIQINRQDERNADFSVSSIELDSAAIGKLILDGSIALKEARSALNINAKYGLTEAEHDLTLSGELSNPSPKSTKFLAAISSTRREFLNFDIAYTSARSISGFENTLLVHRGSDEATRLTLSQTSSYKWESSKLFDIRNLIEVTYPKRSLNFYLKADAKNNKEQSGNFELRAGSDTSALVKYSATGDDLSTYDLNGSLKYPGQSISFSEVAKKLSAGKWKYMTAFSSEAEGKSPFRFNADTDLSLKYEKENTQSEIVSRITSTAFAEPYLLNSNVQSRKELYQANFKLSQRSGDVFNFATDYRRALGNNPSKFLTKAFVSKYLDANLQETHDRATSNFKFDATWIPTGRQILATSDLKKQGEHTYNLDADLKWDATRDLRQSASWKSVTLISHRGGFVLDSKNNVIVQGEARVVNLNGKMSSDYLNGENTVDVSFRSSDGKDYGLLLINVNENKDKIKASKVGLKVSLPETSPFEIELANRASNVDLAKYIFELATELKVNYMGDKNVNLQAELHSILTNRRTVSALLEASGSAISSPLRLDFNTELQRGHGKIAGSARRGSKSGDFELEIDFDRWSPKKTLEVKYKVNTPFSSFKSLEGLAKYGYIFTTWKNFDLSESGNFVLNGENPTSWDNGLSFLNNDFGAKYNLVGEGSSLIAFNVNGKVQPKKISVKVTNTFRGEDVKVNIDYQRSNPINVIISLTSPYKSYEKVDLRITHKSTKAGGGGYSYSTSLAAQSAAERLGLISKLELSDLKKALDLTFSLTDTPTRKLSLSLTGLNSDKYTVDTMVLWGDDGKFLSTKGNLLRSGDVVDGDLTLSSPALNADKWNVRVSKKLSDAGRNMIEFHVMSADQEHAALVVDYAKKGDRIISTYDGKINVKANKADFGGEFRVDDRTFEMGRDGEAGREFKTSINLISDKYPLKLEFVGKGTTSENLLSASFCNEGDLDCKIAQLSHKTSDRGYELSAITKSITEGKEARDGLVVKTERPSPSAYEHSVKLLSSDEDQQVQTLGYKLFRNNGIAQPKSGLEVYLPGRQAALLYTRKEAEVNEYVLEAWLDQLRRPEDRLSLTFLHDKKEAYAVTLKHPSLKKDMKMTSNIRVHEGQYISDITADLDIFKGQPLALLFKLKRSPTRRENEFLHGLDFSAKGAAGVSFNLRSDVTLGAGELLTKTKVEYLNREQRNRIYEISLDYGFNHRTLEVVGPDGRILMYGSRYSHHAVPGTTDSDGYDVRREIFLPGMKDTRIFQNSVTTAFPPSAHIKMFTASSPPGQFYEAWVGFKNEKSFAAGVYGNEAGSEQDILADLSVALNNSRLLFVKTDWDKENIRQFLEKTEDRLTDTVLRFKAMSQATSEYLEKEIAHVRWNIARALPNLRPILKTYRTQWEEIREEVKSAEVINHFGHYLEFLLTFVGSDTEEVQRQFESLISLISNAAEAFMNVVNSLPEKFDRLVERLPTIFEGIQKGLGLTLDALVETFKLAVRGITGAFDKISASNPAVANKVEYLSDTTKGIGKFLNQALAETVETLTEVWETIRSTSTNVFQSETVQYYVKSFGKKYEYLFTEMIDEYKRDAEAFRDSILRALPDKEVQEFMQAVIEYVETKAAKSTSVDDAAAQKEIYKKFVKAVKKIKSNLFTVDLKNGHFIAQIPLPVPVQSLMDMDQVFSLPIPSGAFKTPSYTYGIQEAYNQLKSAGSIKELIPPFKATGLLIGSQYYRTFDGKFYHFEGKCQYLLASDFVDKNFTVVVDYDAQSQASVQKSLIVTDQKDTISLQPDHTVLVNGKPSKVPAQIGNLEVRREEDWIVVRGRDGGFSASCSALEDVCAVEIDGFYHGKTSGLFGTYNNEYFDDLHTTSGAIVKSPERMAVDWKLERQCQESPVPVHTKTSDSNVLRKCADAFSGKSSPLRPCFGVVEPSEYRTICESLSEEKGYDADRAVCNSAHGYQAACRDSRISIDPSQLCSPSA